MRNGIHAEWTKLRTLTSTYWLLAGTLVLTVGISAAVAAASAYHPDSPKQDTVKLALTGVDLGQGIIAVLAALAVSNEYSTGMIRTTLAATPRRLSLLAAKSAPVTLAVVLAAIISVGCCLVAGRLILPTSGYTPAHGYAPLSLNHGPTLRAAIGSVLYLAFIGLLSLGVASTVRDTAVAIGTTLGLLYLFPLLAQTVNSPVWHRHLEQLGPMTAGMAIQATTNLRTLPISPWAGLGVLAAWSAAALLVGAFLLRARDA